MKNLAMFILLLLSGFIIEFIIDGAVTVKDAFAVMSASLAAIGIGAIIEELAQRSEKVKTTTITGKDLMLNIDRANRSDRKA